MFVRQRAAELIQYLEQEPHDVEALREPLVADEEALDFARPEHLAERLVELFEPLGLSLQAHREFLIDAVFDPAAALPVPEVEGLRYPSVVGFIDHLQAAVAELRAVAGSPLTRELAPLRGVLERLLRDTVQELDEYPKREKSELSLKALRLIEDFDPSGSKEDPAGSKRDPAGSKEGHMDVAVRVGEFFKTEPPQAGASSAQLRAMRVERMRKREQRAKSSAPQVEEPSNVSVGPSQRQERDK